MYLRRWTRVEKEGRNLKAEENALETLEQFVDGQRRGAKTEYGDSLFATLLEVQGVVRKDWKGVIRTWEEMKGEAGLNEKAVEMYLLACLETSSFDKGRTLLATLQTFPSMLPLLTSKNWSIYYSMLVKAKDLPSLVRSVVFQASSKHEDASPLAVEDLAKGIQLAREVGGEEGKTAEGKLVDLVGKERFEEAVGR
ncbi:hypothetical protein BDY24DRAFT_389450, partial [Mrakia frigida]|uniref:uncharacterized protein n=1 Tax=Mrakia frigida TaxID=29902 RepID=UPI003FCC1717